MCSQDLTLLEDVLSQNTSYLVHFMGTGRYPRACVQQEVKIADLTILSVFQTVTLWC